MKLYNMDLSNFATKSRLVIYEKGLNIEMAPIPGGDLSSPEYAKVNPLGKTPALDADGLLIPGVRGHQRVPRGQVPDAAAAAEEPRGPRQGANLHPLPRPLPRAATARAVRPDESEDARRKSRRRESDRPQASPRPARKDARRWRLRLRRRLHARRLRARAHDVLHHQPRACVRRQAARRTSENRGVVDSRPDAAVGEEGPRRDGGERWLRCSAAAAESRDFLSLEKKRERPRRCSRFRQTNGGRAASRRLPPRTRSPRARRTARIR